MRLVLLSGVLLVLSFPHFGHPAVAWVALVPLLMALTGWTGRPARVSVHGRSPLRAFLLGLTSGVVYFAGTLYWTGAVISTFGGVPAAVGVLAVVLLAFYQGFFPALLKQPSQVAVRKQSAEAAIGIGQHHGSGSSAAQSASG